MTIVGASMTGRKKGGGGVGHATECRGRYVHVVAGQKSGIGFVGHWVQRC